MGFGGKGANQCVMAARLGAKTAMVAKVSKLVKDSEVFVCSTTVKVVACGRLDCRRCELNTVTLPGDSNV